MSDREPQREPSFRLDDFRKWMETQKSPSFCKRKDESTSKVVGQHADPKLTGKKLSNRMTPEDGGDLQELVRDFRRNGGVVVRVDEQYLIIEVNSGTFSIPKFFVRLRGA